ncbi:hypothetical protein SaSA201_0401 [Streptococcus agalactiae]|uniref:hypothetical protein n=1 Tax=Streptococcus agalactiae TaxID=1311 RepID=UPI0002822F8E|nr:hypothetical protein [Streptococcus agalactiae]AHN30043.1 hypothetical protein V193_02365 [Streptococcus agalactiae 138P]EJZ03980.1 hypothetical protein M3M_01252 [Streptococcus agalactiae STIR-CD-17]EPU02115.1 hypothetical protein SAG0123_00200 [Streptococcus agalactiae STIR-CD-13]EPU03807.1 hypothetical protein SAG0122_04145 [Streptococcus agalactiae STIR-CD-09]EPW81339.1 hypothetical protein SAG0121_01580 [Streptococcus agalactiae STIR-CD-07]
MQQNKEVIIYAPEIIEEDETIKTTYSEEIDEIVKTAKSTINTISNQIDYGLVGKFGKMVKSQIEENKNSYDNL